MAADAIVGATPVEGQEIQIPSVLRCALLILGVKIALKSRGFSWTIAWIRRRVRSVAEIASVGVSFVKATEQAVAMAGALYPGRALCLEQSFVLYYVLRRQGVSVKFRMGIQAHPFTAHAWVEYRDDPINDVAEHIKLFARLPEELP